MNILKRLYRKMPDRVKIVIISIYNIIYQKKIYYMLHKPKEKEIIQVLRKLNMINIKAFNKNMWKLEPTFTQYYSGYMEGKKVFCKVCFNDKYKVVEREYNILKRIQKEGSWLSEHVPNVQLYLKENNTELVISEYLEGEKIEKQQTNLLNICEQMMKILKEFREKGIIHGDIRPSNFILKDEKVYIIDFGTAYDKNQSANDCIYHNMIMPKALSWMGCGKYSPDDYEYDDAYAVLRTLKDIYPDFKKDYKSQWRELNMLIGTYTLKFMNE